MSLVFDYDGVLVDTRDANIEAINAFATRYGFEPMSIADYTRMLDHNFSEYWQMLLGRRAREFMRDLHTYPRPQPQLVAGMRELLLQHRPAIVSSNHGALIREVLSRNGIDIPVYGVEVDASKTRKLNKLRREPDVFVTDTTGDVVEGLRAGYVVIAVSWGFTPVATLQRARPTRLVHSPHELHQTIAAFTPHVIPLITV